MFCISDPTHLEDIEGQGQDQQKKNKIKMTRMIKIIQTVR